MKEERPYYEHADTRSHIRYWVFGQMMSGAAKAALVVVGIGVLLYAIYLVSLTLPEASKQAPSPQQSGALEMPLGGERAA